MCLSVYLDLPQRELTEAQAKNNNLCSGNVVKTVQAPIVGDPRSVSQISMAKNATLDTGNCVSYKKPCVEK